MLSENHDITIVLDRVCSECQGPLVRQRNEMVCIPCNARGRHDELLERYALFVLYCKAKDRELAYMSIDEREAYTFAELFRNNCKSWCDPQDIKKAVKHKTIGRDPYQAL